MRSVLDDGGVGQPVVQPAAVAVDDQGRHKQTQQRGPDDGAPRGQPVSLPGMGQASPNSRMPGV